MKTLRVLLTGGGSGGHIFPLIAVAEELKIRSADFNMELDLKYFGADKEYAQLLVDNGIDFIPILSSKLRRYWSPLNLIDALKFFLSLFQAFWKIFWFMPNVVFSKGGPGALAVILASKFYLIPVIIHESDTIPGMTNRISGNWAEKIYLAFSSAAEYFKNQNLEIIGNPVRNSLFNQLADAGQNGQGAQMTAKKEFGFNPNEPAILILGGSQGAGKINYFILENLDLFIRDFQVLHQVGRKNYVGYQKELEFSNKNWSDFEKNRYHYQAFFEKDLSNALVAADLVLARAGAGTIFELAAAGKPAILFPILESANDHQKQNAYFYSKSGAAIVIQEENLLGNLVVDEINKLLSNPNQLQKMAEAARSFYRPEAAAIIAKNLLTYV